MSLTRWVSAATGVLSFLLFLPGIFRESYISEKELEALKKMAEKEESKAGDGGGGRSLVRRISRVVEQADHTGPTAGRTTEDERRIKRRISRVAMQEVESERRNLERMQSTGEKFLSNLRKYSMTSPHDSNITMTDPSLGNSSSNISPPTVSPLTPLYRGRC